jgi:hypothetical protein
MPGDGARRGGVARPKPESESDEVRHNIKWHALVNQSMDQVKKGKDSKGGELCKATNQQTNRSISSPPLTASLLVSKINHFKPKTKLFLKLYLTREISQTKQKKSFDKKKICILFLPPHKFINELDLRPRKLAPAPPYLATEEIRVRVRPRSIP